MAQRWIIGLASGSSGDGIDAAMVEVSGVGLELRVLQCHALHKAHPPELRQQLRAVCAQSCDVLEVSRLHRLLGETFAGAARAVADSAAIGLQKVMCVGCPGHTVGHETEGRFPAALALGMPAVVAERCGVTTVSNFRDRDLSAGGHGTPLSALADHVLFRHAGEGRVVLHLGGVARLAYLPPSAKVNDVVAFEAAPCNLLLDGLIRQLTSGRENYDPGGRHAVQGKCVEPLLASWLAHPALQPRPPRCLPRRAFADAFVQQAVTQVREFGASLHDLLCTAAHFVSRSIGVAMKRFVPEAQVDRVLLSGGGVRNGLLWHLLQQLWPGVPLMRSDEVGVSAEFREAISTAVLSALTLDGVPGNVPMITGAAGSRLLGSLTPGLSANWARCLHWMAQQAGPPGSGH